MSHLDQHGWQWVEGASACAVHELFEVSAEELKHLQDAMQRSDSCCNAVPVKLSALLCHSRLHTIPALAERCCRLTRYKTGLLCSSTCSTHSNLQQQ